MNAQWTTYFQTMCNIRSDFTDRTFLKMTMTVEEMQNLYPHDTITTHKCYTTNRVTCDK